MPDEQLNSPDGAFAHNGVHPPNRGEDFALQPNGIKENRVDSTPHFEPIAICGMACRLPGSVHSPQDLWELLLAKKDARTRVPETRYNVSAYHWPTRKPGHTVSEHGYFLDDTVGLGHLDTSVFPMPRSELETLDPQQRILLEVARESLDDAGETNWRGKDVGVYVGNFGSDWYDIVQKESQRHGTYYISTSHDFAISNRVSHELDLRGPSMTIRTACSSSLIALSDACSAIARGECSSAIVGGTNIIVAPALTTDSSCQGTLSPDGSCKTFSSNANGYARGEGVIALYIKSLRDAQRDGNPIRSVIVGAAANCDGKTPNLLTPSSEAQEALIRRAYKTAGIPEPDIRNTGLFECHGTGTPTGDPTETAAITKVIGASSKMYIGSIKPNIGHGEGASGLASVLKAVLCLEHQTLAPNIKCLPLSERVFSENKLEVPMEAIPWPKDCHERVSVNSFGIGGSNAHVIIDSARRFKHHNASQEKKLARDSSEPQLLVFSASSPLSLQQMTEKYLSLLEEDNEALNLRDLAYTLARKREHLPFRAFTVATRDQVSPVSQPKSATSTSSVVMVFTGQGAQWPQMGRELLRRNQVFRDSIQASDGYLQALGAEAPEWKIAEELVKPARTSRVAEAEFSQPLCTAMQIALVDVMFAAGIRPCAVVGHSSGEIAAAYASGALTAHEAITVAFFRGLVAKSQSRPGAMAAVGLSREAVKGFLIPGVVLACDNSPNSVTISGDADAILSVTSTIKSELPDVLITLLKLNKAYHSHHMAEVEHLYRELMVNAGVKGQSPSLPFYSSVTGRQIDDNKSLHRKSPFSPEYWQANLASPVLFRQAVSSLIDHFPLPSEDLAFLEIGPHGALAGPLRQILGGHSKTAPYVSIMKRGEKASETLLDAVGKLWTLGVSVDFDTIMPSGNSISSLPYYPWNHQRSYWKEARVAVEWRLRENPHHDLLGTKVPESSALEPLWRNLFHLDNVPWVRDHQIDGEVVFPFAAYVAMAAEAVRQTTKVQDSVELRRVVVERALVINEGEPTELLTTFRRHRLTNSLESQWWEFTITAYNGHSWTKHCFGEVRASNATSWKCDKSPTGTIAPHHVNKQQWYERVRRGGLHYGPHFQALDQIRSNVEESEGLATSTIANTGHGDEPFYHLHPVVLDSFFQLVGVAAHRGFTHNYKQRLPSSAEYIALSRSSIEQLDIHANCKQLGSVLVGGGSCTAGSTAVMKVSGVRFAELKSAEDSVTGLGIPNIARGEWVAAVDFLKVDTLVRPATDHSSYFDRLDRLASLSILLSKRLVSASETSPTLAKHLRSYKAWLQHFDLSGVGSLTTHNATIQLEELRKSLSTSPAAPIVSAITGVHERLSFILSEQQDALDVLNAEGSLQKIADFLSQHNVSDMLRQLSHETPNLKVLEVGSSASPAIGDSVKALRRPDGMSLYSKYTYADKVLAEVETAKVRYQEYPNLHFACFDIGKDLAEQDFHDQNFDLIIARNILHESPSLRRTLENLHKLLRPGGFLLLHQPRQGLTWLKYALGSLPQWWCGLNDNRLHDPHVTLSRWQEELEGSGFEGIEAAIPDSPNTCQMSMAIVAKAKIQITKPKCLTLLRSSNECSTRGKNLERAFLARGYQVAYRLMGEEFTEGEDIIILLDFDEPFFHHIDTNNFERFKIWVQHVVSTNSGILWVTKPSQSICADPRHALIIGLARTLRTELGVDFATCEIEDLESTASLQSIINVFEHFRGRSVRITSDFEYAIIDGTVRVNRFIPYQPVQDDEKVDPGSFRTKIALTVQSPGRLDSLQWERWALTTLASHDVEIEVHAVGLNFRDVLEAMGIIGLVDDANELGLEAAGTVRRVGSDVTTVSVGDRVVATGTGAFATFLKTSELLCTRLADELSFEQGASMVVVFLTAIHALVYVGRLERGQSVLIHSGCGGVGLAAIQVARALGVTIYTTVGNQQKVTYLMEKFALPRECIFSSRDESFYDGIMRETGGRGVDVALNSLSGELLHATWRSVAKWGTMVEIGKADLLGAGKLDMDRFLESRNYCCFDLRQMAAEKPELIQRHLRTMVSYYHQRFIEPIRLAQTSPATHVVQAFREMQQGNHIGKIVVSLRDGEGTLQLGDGSLAEKTKDVSLDEAATYILVGGLGGLGRSVSIWMAQHGARNLIFLGRNAGEGTDDASHVATLQSMGCDVQLVRGSVAEETDIARAMDNATKPIKGIVHMGMVLRDRSFFQMGVEDWDAAVKPKVTGVFNLHKALVVRNLNLDFFLLFSSLSGILGQTGQANYAAANTFLDAMGSHLDANGVPCTVLDIGAVEGIGYLAGNEALLRKMRGTGWSTVKEEDLLKVVNTAMLRCAGPRHTQDTAGFIAPLVKESSILIGLSPDSMLNNNETSRHREDPRLIACMRVEQNDSSASTNQNPLKIFLRAAANNPAILAEPEVSMMLAREIGKKLFTLLLKPDEEPDLNSSLSELGLDSLIAVEMRSWWKQSLGLDISVLEMLGMGTLTALGKNAIQKLSAKYEN